MGSLCASPRANTGTLDATIRVKLRPDGYVGWCAEFGNAAAVSHRESCSVTVTGIDSGPRGSVVLRIRGPEEGIERWLSGEASAAALLSEAYVVEIGDVTWTADAPDGWLNESVVEGGGWPMRERRF